MKTKQFKSGTVFLVLSLIGCLFCSVFLFVKEMQHVRKLEKAMFRKQKTDSLLIDKMAASLDQIMKSIGKNLILYPPQLKNVVCAQQMGIVKQVRKIEIDSIFAPYNPSLLEKEEGGYHLFFRYDEPKDLWRSIPFYSRIGYCELDSDFAIRKTIAKIDTGSNFSEDPRAVRVGGKFFLSWNDVLDLRNGGRCLYVGEWNPKKCKLEYSSALPLSIKPVEKNWVPFERKQGLKSSLGFVYGICPHKILAMEDPKSPELIHCIDKNYTALHKIEWGEKWGGLSGGTTARLVDKEYISFFHSSFKHKEKIWYVMGAYTFDASPPYKIRSVTAHPILFPGIYSSEILNTADPNKFCIFPAGIALEKKNDKTLLHVSCGENDSAVKIVTVDYEKLKKIMIPVN